jgi:4-hydroxy-3-polyprenylbenzoate decarboxylase
MDEALFAGFIAGRRMEFAPGRTVSVPVPASAEFVIEGVVPAKGTRLEGPFGDHFGHYSAAAEFPVMQVRCVTHRRGAIYPGIVVGKPPMEDRFLGDATQQILGPLIRLIHKEVTGMWAYYEAGFHNLLVVAIEERYRKEAMKAALGIMGTDQLSLTKCIIAVSAGTDPRDWKAVLRQVREHFDPHSDFVLIPRVPLDTLDFTSYTMNLGSKMVLDATRKPAGSSRPDQPARPDRPARIDVPHADAISRDARSADSRILGTAFIESCLLVVKVATLSGASGASAQAAAAAQPGSSSRPGSPATTGRSVLEKLLADPRFAQVPLIAVVSEDVDISNPESYIWGIFTRFDCERDVIFAEQKLIGISPVYRGPMGIDATWKPGYPEPLVMDEDVVRRVDAKWESIWK